MTLQSRRWWQLTSISFVANSIAPFGLKILAERRLTDRYEFQYLGYLYLGGLIFAVSTFRMWPLRLRVKEIIIGLGMAACSVAGFSLTGLALSNGVPGYITFPVTNGGALFLVAGAGIVMFGERLGKRGLLGLVLGIVAVAILSMA